MRVIAGLYKGRPLAAPKGSNTRPTTDRVKESLMSTLLSACGSFDGAYVLDAFAGSGALGIECISRGAAAAHFFERDRDALAALRENIGKLGISPHQARVFRADIMKNPPVIGAVSYDIVFLTPLTLIRSRMSWVLFSSSKTTGGLRRDAWSATSTPPRTILPHFSTCGA